jgi:hypothetical protein
MYNLDFSGAHRTFQAWQVSHPQDPLGFVSDAAAYFFSELNRMHILELDLFTEDERYKAQGKLVADAAAKAGFDADMEKSEQLARRILVRTPGDREAAFAEVMVNGLRGDYLALVDKRNLAGLSYIKSARAMAEKLLAIDPKCYDAYLAVGAENYILSLNPAPVRWLLRITGAQTSKQEGIARLQLTAEKGQYLGPYARLLLAVAAMRDKDRATARRLLQGLAHDFPKNQLYAKELSRIPAE